MFIQCDLVSPADRQNRVSIAFLTNEHKVDHVLRVRV